MNCCVKYCGGCQAAYDRVRFVEEIKKARPGISFVRCGDGTACDALLLVCGCKARCVLDRDYTTARVIVADSEEAYCQVVKELSAPPFD